MTCVTAIDTKKLLDSLHVGLGQKGRCTGPGLLCRADARGPLRSLGEEGGEELSGRPPYTDVVFLSFAARTGGREVSH